MKKQHIPYTESIVFAAEYLSRACTEYARKVIKENDFELSYEEYFILYVVIFNPGLIQMDIAKKLFMQRSYLCKLLSKLEEGGFILREKTIKGKRQSVIKVYATEKGRKMHSVMINSFRKDVLQKPLIEHSKIVEITNDLFSMADKIVDTFNLKL